MRLHRFVPFLLSALTTLSAFSVYADAPKLDIEYDEQGNHLHFILTSNGEALQQNQVSISFDDTSSKSGPLLKLEITKASTKGRWIRTFSQNDKDPDIKGILIKQNGNNKDQVDIRIRFKKRISSKVKSQIKISQLGSKIKIIVPKSVATKRVVTPDPIDPKVAKMRMITAPLSDDAQPLATATTPQKTAVTQQRPMVTGSLLEKANRPTPLPPSVGKMRKVNTPSDPSSSVKKPTSFQTIAPPQNNQPSSKPNHRANSRPQKASTARTTAFGDPRDSTMKEQLPSEKLTDHSPEDDVPSWMLMTVAALFFIVAIFLFAKSKRAINLKNQGDVSIRILAQEVVQYRPLQRILLVEVLDHTLVVGSSDAGGLSLLAQISPKPGPSAQEYPSYDEGYSSFDASHFNEGEYRPSEYKAEPHIQPMRHSLDPSVERRGYEEEYGYDQRSMQNYDEHTYNEDEPYTVEMPVVQSHPSSDRNSELAPNILAPESNADIFSHSGTDRDLFVRSSPGDALSDINALVDEVEDSGYRPAASDALSTPEDDVSADDLLQKIRQLNRG
jgi:flagellar biogenesis protein FliO